MENNEPKEQTPFIQDGVSCPGTPPWPKQSARLSTLPFPLIFIFAAYLLLPGSMIKFIVWLGAVIIFAYPLRYLICARCPYYGKSCSTPMGKIVPHLFKKQEGRSMKLGLWLDVVSFAFLFLLPLPEAWAAGWLILLLWSGLFFVSSLFITRFGCYYCPFTFCPIGKAGRLLWRSRR